MENPYPEIPQPILPAAQSAVLPSLDEYLSGQEDREDIKYYKQYFNILVTRFKANKIEKAEAPLRAANEALRHFYIAGAVPHLNTAYQILCGPRPGDNLRSIVDKMIVDSHQWKHYQAPKPTEWARFSEDWRTVHKIIVYGSKLILEARALELDRGKVLKDQVLDGFVIFNKDIGLPGNYSNKAVQTMRVQLSRSKSEVTGHGYPVLSTDSDFPCVQGSLAKAYDEQLIKVNDEPRSKN